MHPGDAPGPSVDLDEKLAAKYRCERACLSIGLKLCQRAWLPLNRKLDGTLTDW